MKTEAVKRTLEDIANAQAYIANKATYTKDVTEFENKLNELVTEFSK